MSSNPVRDYLEQRERDLEKRIAELEAEIERQQCVIIALSSFYKRASGATNAEVEALVERLSGSKK